MPEIHESILLSVKKLNNVAPEYTAFDTDFILYINSAFAELNQLGIGPSEGFEIIDEDDLWEDVLGLDPRFNSIKTYVQAYVRLRFDPPGTSFAITMMEKQLEEYKWRATVLADDIKAEEIV